jgi:hypothetical protein
MKNIVIFTTAICRIDIHNTVLPNIIKMFNSVDVELTYLINIDNVCGNNKYTQEETRENYIKYLKDTNIKYDFIISNTPCFFNAVKNLLLLSDKYINEDSIIFWLEDDWYINDKNIYKFKDIIEKNFEHNLYISLTVLSKKDKQKNRLFKKLFKKIPPYQFRPCIWSYNLFKSIFYSAIITSKNIGDPEQIVKNYSIENCEKYEYDIIFYEIFVDIGRTWYKCNSIYKWNKNIVNQYITYL